MNNSKPSVCPSTLREGREGYSRQALEELFGGGETSPYLDFRLDVNIRPIEPGDSRMSISGVQEKFPGKIEGGKIRLAEASERSTHILKPFPGDIYLLDRREIPANEHLTMQIAAQVFGIRTAANGLCFDLKGKPVYITRRFDITPDGTKLRMEDFASVMGKSELTGGGSAFKYSGSYLEIAEALGRYSSTKMVELERLFNLIVFNYVFANGDAHLKNFSLIETGGERRLAPAYDLMNTALHINDGDFALEGGLGVEKSDIYERSGHPARKDFEEFGRAAGLMEKRVRRLLDRYRELPAEAIKLLSNSYLSDKAKRSYLRIVNERIARLNRGRGES